jgi:hypothetical protein
MKAVEHAVYSRRHTGGTCPGAARMLHTACRVLHLLIMTPNFYLQLRLG